MCSTSNEIRNILLCSFLQRKFFDEARDVRNTARVRRHGGHDDIPTSCSSANDEFECELVIMDRDIAENPLRVAKIEAYKPFEYSKYSLKYLLYQIPSQV